jgi:hypothetical protein
MRRGSFPDFTAFSADAFWRSGHFSLLSDHMDKLDLSCISASLFTPSLYTTFVMASSFSRLQECYPQRGMGTHKVLIRPPPLQMGQ